MGSEDLLYQQNEFVVGLLFVVLLVAANEAGYWLGRRRAARTAKAAKVPEGRASPTSADEATTAHVIAVQTAVFALLGLLLAFTVAMAVSRYDSRKQALVSETNAIDTARLRIQLLPEAQRTTTVVLMRQYVSARVASARPDWFLDVALRDRTATLQQQLWAQGAAAAQQDPRAVTTGLYVQALNDMFGAQGARDAARLNILPASTLYLLVVVSLLGMGLLGYTAGLGGGRSFAGAVVLALLLSLVVMIIIDIDHPYQGFITISQQSLIQLQQSMGNGP